MPIPCARCRMPLPKWELVSGSLATCPSCMSANTVRVFPAILHSGAPALPETAMAGEACCYDHPTKRAVAACAQCGRFICQLCSVDFGGGTWCPSCVAAGAGAAKEANAETGRTLYDTMVLLLPFATLVFWPLLVLTGPGTVILAAMKWKQPLSLVRRSRWRFVVGIAFGLSATAACVWMFIYLATVGKTAAR
jgi:hypothetical protein